MKHHENNCKRREETRLPLFASSHSPGRQRSEIRGNLPAGKSSPHQEKMTGVSPADAIFWATSCLGFIPPTAVKLGPTEMDRKREKKPGTTESSQGVAVTAVHSGLCYGQTSRFCRCRKRQEASQLLRCNAGDLGLITVVGRSPGEGNSSPLQDSGLDDSMDCIVHGVAKSWTQLSDFHFHFPPSRGKTIFSDFQIILFHPPHKKHRL